MFKKLFIFLILLALLVGIAAAVPPLPCAFYGTVKIGGGDAPPGTEIVAKFAGTSHGQTTTTQWGKYGGTSGSKLEVALTETEVNNCCYSCNGCTLLIEFYINGKKADQTSMFEDGGFKELNLTVSGVAPPTSSPTTSPTTQIPTSSGTPVPTTAIPTSSPTPKPTSLPALPHSFYGTVMIGEGIPASAGTEIEARASGVIQGPKNPVTVTTPGFYGGTGPYDQKLEVQGYTATGEPLEFYVGGTRAECHDVSAGTGWSYTYPYSPGNSTELNLRINVTAPVAEFTMNPPAGYEILSVKFTDVSTGPPTSWLWNFGDGTTSTLQSPVHRYYNGKYIITLTVSNAAGSSSASQNLTVYKQSSPGGGGGGGGGGGYYTVPQSTTSNQTVTPTPTPTVTQVPVPPGGTLPLNSALALSQSVVIASQDNTGFISMTAGMRPTNASGEPLLTLTVKRIPAESVPPVPTGSTYSFAGYAYEVEPSGASFDPYVTLSITLSEADFAGLQGREIFIKWYNPATSAWEDIPTTVDPASRTASAKITHTSIFGLFASNPPATVATSTPTTTAPASGIGGISWLWIIVIAVIIIAVILAAFYMLKQREQAGEPPCEEEDWKLE